LCVAIDQEYFVARWSQCLQEKHPKMRHEIACDSIVGVVKQNAHTLISISDAASLMLNGAGRDPRINLISKLPVECRKTSACAAEHTISLTL
jgi:hypothetical protein